MKLVYLKYWDNLFFRLTGIILFTWNNISLLCKEDVSIRQENISLWNKAARLHLFSDYQEYYHIYKSERNFIWNIIQR